MMTTSVDSPLPVHTAGREADDLMVVIGLVSGAQLRGRLGRRGAEHIVNRLNNWPDPMLQLGPAAPAEATWVRTIVARSEVAWVHQLQAGAGETSFSLAGSHAAGLAATQPVLVRVGAFEVRGTPEVFHQVDWADYLLACASDGRFFVLRDAHVSGPATDLQLPALAVNAARVGALLTLD